MQFNSYSFLLLFMPVSVALYFLFNRISRKAGQLFLVLASAVFYAFAGWRCALVLLLSLCVNYLAGKLSTEHPKQGKTIILLGLIFNIGLLFYFKYFNFFISNMELLLGREAVVRDIILPLGISFFTFQQISYLVSIYKKKAALCSFTEYAAYILFFPKLVMGPLIEPEEFISQLRDDKRRNPVYENLTGGFMMFNLGLFKKVIIADTFAAAANTGFDLMMSLSSADTLITMLAYTMQIYFDFSAYSDMACGIGKMLNFDLPVNFDSPYRALSMGQFWKRWHMSLTAFFTKYIYIPLGGSRRGAVRTAVNVMIVFLISGLWHGANWTFILWGALHGLLLVADKLIKKHYEKLPAALRWVLTFGIVNILWLLFRSPDIGVWLGLLKNMFSLSSLSISSEIISAFYTPELNMLREVLPFGNMLSGFQALVFVLVSVFLLFFCQNPQRREYKDSIHGAIGHALIFIWCLVALSPDAGFVYFGF